MRHFYFTEILLIDGNEIMLESASLPLSKSYKDELMAGINNLLFKR
jgi:hypothetical protein